MLNEPIDSVVVTSGSTVGANVVGSIAKRWKPEARAWSRNRPEWCRIAEPLVSFVEIGVPIAVRAPVL